jgi:hypothetical protein
LIATTYVAAFLAVAASVVVGRAIMVVCGKQGWSGIEPAVGLAAIFALLGVLARFPATRVGLLAGSGALLLASLWVLIAHRRRAGTLSAPRDPWFWLATALAAVLTTIPFVISGRWGLPGMGYNNDLGLHLAWTQSLISSFGTEPSAGYPLGPHGLAASLSSLPGLSLRSAFVGLLIAIPVLSTMTAWSALAHLGSLRRALASVLVAFCYLMAAYFAQGAFKETATAMFVLAFTVALPGLRSIPSGRRGRIKAVAPFLVLLAGILFTFSFPGLVFPAVIAAAWLLTDPSLRSNLHPSRFSALVKGPWLVLAGLLVVVTVLIFAFGGQLGFAEGFREVSRSNAFGPVSVLEAFGVWLTSDYRLDGYPAAPVPGLLGAIGVAALVLALIWWRTRPRSVYPAALLGLGALYLASLPWVGDYSLAKALAISAPLIMLTVLSALLSPAPKTVIGNFRIPPVAWVAFAAAFCSLAAASSFMVLRDTSVSPPGRAAELLAFRDELKGRKVLYADQDRFGPAYLPESTVSLPLKDYPEPDVSADPKKPFETDYGQSAIDFDSFDAATLNRHDFVITTAAPWTSKAPPSFKLVNQTPSFKLWKRTGRTFDRPILNERTMPAQFVDCAEAGGRHVSQLDGEAVVMPETVVGLASEWDPSSEIAPGNSSSISLDLGRGTWRISLQYMTPQGMTLSAPGYERGFAAAIDGQRLSNRATGSYGQFWPAGRIQVPRAGPVEFTAETASPSFLQRLTGYSRVTRLGRIVLMRQAPRERVPMSEVCGRWVDFFRLSPADAGDRAGPAGDSATLP